jgi:hypothetical protein
VRRARRPPKFAFKVEALEVRSLLSTTGNVFRLPNVKPLVKSAAEVAKTTPTVFADLLGSLQAQLTDGPLVALAGGKVGGDVFVAGVSSMVSSFDFKVSQLLNRVSPQGLRTTFPWVFWGFHEKYKIFI